MKSIRYYVFGCIVFLQITNVLATTLNETKTPHLLDADLAGIDVYQKLYFVDAKTFIFLREQELLLSLSPSIQLGINVPYLNHLERELNFARLGDVKFNLNIATDWFKKYLSINFFLEYNIGNGPAFDDINTHPMENYGYPEWRWGFIFFKKFDYFSLTSNLFYVFRSYNEITFGQAFFDDGDTLNVFKAEAWKRGLGFNPAHKKTFFYSENLKNDNLEYLLAFNSDLPYPFVPFVEFTFSHDFYGSTSKKQYKSLGPGSGVFRSQMALGTKFFLAEDHFVLKASLILPIGEMVSFYNFGAGFGVRLEF